MRRVGVQQIAAVDVRAVKGFARYVNPAAPRRNGDCRDSPPHARDRPLTSAGEPVRLTQAQHSPKKAGPSPVPAPQLEQKAIPPPAPPTTEGKAPDLPHLRIVAAEIQITPKIVSIADYRSGFKGTEEELQCHRRKRINTLGVYSASVLVSSRTQLLRVVGDAGRGSDFP